MKCCAVRSSVLALLSLLAVPMYVGTTEAASIPVANASFESPAVDPNGFGAWPFIDGWIERDLDQVGSQNTGVFLNTPEGSPDRLANADGDQLAFLGSQQGNALEQDLDAVYRTGVEYELTVAVGISSLFPPSQDEPVDTLELAFYYLDGPNSIDIAVTAIPATGLSSTRLLDFSVCLPPVEPNDPWAGLPIGIAVRSVGAAGGFWDLDHVRLEDSLPVVVPVANASFESPAVDPNGFGAWPVIDEWIELDLDEMGSQNTGVFLNTPEGSPDRLENADGSQLAFLGSALGNALVQDVNVVYEVGCDYRLTVGVGVSSLFPPLRVEPVDTLELVLYYLDGPNSVDVASQEVPATGLSSTQLTDFSVYLPATEPDDPWAGRPIGIAIRALGNAGGFWDLDNVRLLKSQPKALPIENASFESPKVDPNGFGAWPVIDEWIELDLDEMGSQNTGVFLNTPEGSPDRLENADGSQLAFLGSAQGNAVLQDLQAAYRVGRGYRLSVGVGVSSLFPPATAEPIDALELVLYYRDDANTVDIAAEAVEATGLSSTQLQSFSVYVPAVEPDDAWAGKPIGIAIRAAGMAGGFWDLDNVRLTASLLAVDPAPAAKE